MKQNLSQNSKIINSFNLPEEFKKYKQTYKQHQNRPSRAKVSMRFWALPSADSVLIAVFMDRQH